MRFRKPFRATPIGMGKVYRQRTARANRARRLKNAALFSAVGLAVFGIGMVVTRSGSVPWSALASAESTDSGECHLLRVHDGDTIRCGAERIRIENIDAPELEGSPKCEDYRSTNAWCDFEAGRRSRAALQSFLAGGRIEVSRHGKDKYGRTLARLTINGKDAGDYLVSQGLAKPWN